MSRTIGTVVRGVRAPIFRQGDDVVSIAADTVANALAEEGITPRDKDVVAITESVVARCQGNYATVQQIAADVKAKTGGKAVGVAFPILSRNRFSLLLSGIASGAKKIVLLLSLPSDEVGNHLVSMDQLDEAGVDPYRDVLTLEQFRSHFGSVIHPFTGVDYVDYYQSLIQEAGAQVEIIFSNRVQSILPYTDTVICCDIHTRQRSKRLPKSAGARCVLGLDDLLTTSVDGSGYNPQYGLLGSNKADDGRVKLFPRDTMADVIAMDANGQYLDTVYTNISTAHSYGDGKDLSCRLTTDAVSRLLYGAPVSRYVALDYDALYTLNDLIGGLTITFDDDYTEIHSTFTKGSTVTLNRWYMDKFITYRSETDLEGAYKRGMRSMAVMKALFNQCKGKIVADPAVALEYYNGLKDYITTDLDLTEITYLARNMGKMYFTSDTIVRLPGETVMGERYAEFYPDESWLHDFVVEKFCVPAE